MDTLLGVKKIPTDDQIRNVLDKVEYHNFNEAFFFGLKLIKDSDCLKKFYVLGKQIVVVALDGTITHSSNSIHCPNCFIKEHGNGVIEYIHNTLGDSIVSPNLNNVIPLPPEHSTKDDTEIKQDCEQKAILRWFENNLAQLNEVLVDEEIIFLADDLHSNFTIVHLLEAKNCHYILNCKEGNHKTIYEFVNCVKLNTYTCYKNVPGCIEMKEHIYSWIEGLPINDENFNCKVNYFKLTIRNAVQSREEIKDLDEQENNSKKKKKRKKKYRVVYKDLTFSFITNLPCNKENIEELVEVGRARWKIENNNFNVLKNNGYEIKHNYGHGKQYLCNTLKTLNMLAFQHHCILSIVDKCWQKVILKYKSRKKIFSVINIYLQVTIYHSFNDLYVALCGQRPPPSDQEEIERLKTENDFLKVQYEGLKKQVEACKKVYSQIIRNKYIISIY
jgi:hypothetical protein